MFSLAHLHGTSRRRRQLLPLAVAGAVALSIASPAPGQATAQGSPPDHAKGGHHKISKGPIDRLSAADRKKQAASKLRDPQRATSTTSVTAAAVSTGPVDMRVLVLATKGEPNPDGVHSIPAGSWDWSLSTLTSALDYTGVPYDTYKATTGQLCVGGTWKLEWDRNANATDTTCSSDKVNTWGSVTPDRLSNGTASAYYQGVMQANGTLSYVNAAGAFVDSALTADEWSALWTFEANFGIRTVSANTYPTADFGLTFKSEDGNPSEARWTGAGSALFPYVNANGTVPIKNAWTYRAGVADADTDVLLTNAANDALAVRHRYPAQGNREAIALTFDSASYFTHGQVLGYGLVNWVTKGLFLGVRQAILTPQPDDLFIHDSMWQGESDGGRTPCGTAPDAETLPEYRMTGDDLRAVLAWQNATQAKGISRDVTIEWPFNGEGTTAAYNTDAGSAPDTLTPAVQQNQGAFNFVNHTYTHQNLDAVSYSVATTEMKRNHQLALSMGLTNYVRANLIQPDISGLTNAEFLRAARDFGIKYLISDTSRTGNFARYGVNEGRYNAFQPSILELARYPVNLYFNVSKPDQWLAEDNCIYPAGAPFGHVATYEQLLDRESDVLVRYLLQGHNRPLMFHQPNTRAYDGTRSLMGDLLDRTLAKYSALVTVPVKSPTMNELGKRQAERMAYNKAIATGTLTASTLPGRSVTFKNTGTTAVVVPITGTANGKRSEVYAGQKISYISIPAGGTVTYRLQ